MSEKNLKARIVNKHDISENWLKATGFIPKQGEIIVYDVDDEHSYERMKIGDGVHNINELPFAVSVMLDDVIDNICNGQSIISGEEVAY